MLAVRMLPHDRCRNFTSRSAYRRALLDNPLSDCNTTWAESLAAYGAWHKEARALLRANAATAPKIVIYMCRETDDRSTIVSQDCGGFADRLGGAVSRMRTLRKSVVTTGLPLLTVCGSLSQLHSLLVRPTRRTYFC